MFVQWAPLTKGIQKRTMQWHWQRARTVSSCKFYFYLFAWICGKVAPVGWQHLDKWAKLIRSDGVSFYYCSVQEFSLFRSKTECCEMHKPVDNFKLKQNHSEWYDSFMNSKLHCYILNIWKTAGIGLFILPLNLCYLGLFVTLHIAF